MTRKLVHAYIYYGSLLLIVVSLPFTILLNSYFIVLLSVNWLLSGQFKSKINQLRHNRTAFLLIGFYLLQLIGLIYSVDVSNGKTELEHKLSLLAFPLILSTSPALSKQQFSYLLKAFVLACSVAMVICLTYAGIEYTKHHQSASFFYHELGKAIQIHAIYFAMYLLFCLFITVQSLLNTWPTISVQRKLLALLWLIFTLAFVTLLASKIIIISVFLFGNIFLIVFFSTRQQLSKGFLLVLILNLLLGISITQLPLVKERFMNSINTELSFIKENKYTPVTPFTGISLRLTIWKFTFDLLNEHQAWFFGVGTGGGQKLLDSAYRKNNMYLGVEGTDRRGYLGYNTHSQYLGTLLELGILGLFFLFIYLFFPAYTAWQYKNYLHLSFILLFAISCLTESMLFTQKGTVFFSLFQALFTFHGNFYPINQQDT